MSFLLNLFRKNIRVVGKDLRGNVYLEEVLKNGALKRKLEGRQPSDYDVGSVPPEWKSWLTFTREHPPSIEELQASEEYQRTIVEKARLIAEKDQALRRIKDQDLKETQALQLGVQIEKLPDSSQPVGFGEAFQPGGWEPQAPKTQ